MRESGGAVIVNRRSFDWQMQFLAASACATTATQLRFGALPIGPGELLFVVWLASISLSVSVWRVPGVATSIRPFLLFWLISAMALTGGAIAGHVLGHFDLKEGLRDALAFALVAATSVAIAVCATADDWTLKALRYLAVTVLTAGVMLAILALTTGRIAGIIFWYQGVRLSGWAQNPNQLALLFVPLPFMLLSIVADAKPALFRWAVMVGVTLVTFMLGILTRSDALFVAWLAGGLMLSSASVAAAIGRQPDSRVRIVLSTLLVVSMLIILWFVGGRIAESLFDYGSAIYQSGGQGSTRLRLWINGISAIAESPLVGLGPGPHSGIHGPHEAMEAHNSLVDWISMTGLVGGLAIAGLVAWLIAGIRWSGPGLMVSAGLVATLVFSFFGFMFRQPIFWIYLVLLSAAAGALARRPQSVSRVVAGNR